MHISLELNSTEHRTYSTSMDRTVGLFNKQSTLFYHLMNLSTVKKNNGTNNFGISDKEYSTCTFQNQMFVLTLNIYELYCKSVPTIC